MLTPEDLARFIAQHGIAAEMIYLTTPTPTVAAAAEAVQARPAQIGKTLLFLVQGRPWLVVANGLHRLDYKRLAAHWGVSRRQVQLADAAAVMAHTGYPVGAVPPFGHRHPLPTLIEHHVLGQALLYAGGGSLNALVRLTTAELQRVLKAPVVACAVEA